MVVSENIIGTRIKARREYLRMRQADVAEQLGVEPTSISNYERGIREVSAYDLGRIATILTVPVAYFYEDMEGSASNSCYDALPPHKKAVADEVIRALYAEMRQTAPPAPTVAETAPDDSKYVVAKIDRTTGTVEISPDFNEEALDAIEREMLTRRDENADIPAPTLEEQLPVFAVR